MSLKTVEQHIFLGSGSGSGTVVPVFNLTVCVSAEMEIKLLFFFRTPGANGWWQWHMGGWSCGVKRWRHGNQLLSQRGLSATESRGEQPTSISVSNGLGLGTTNAACARRLEQEASTGTWVPAKRPSGHKSLCTLIHTLNTLEPHCYLQSCWICSHTS